MKRLFLDVETPGLNPACGQILQVAYLIEVDNKVVLEENLLMRPDIPHCLEPEALAVQGVTAEEVMARELTQARGYKKFINSLRLFVNKYDRKDKFQLVGYNTSFDKDWLYAWANAQGDKYLGSYIWWPPICVGQVAYLELEDARALFPDFKLATLYEAYFGANLEEAHNALADIAATRELFNLLLLLRQ